MENICVGVIIIAYMFYTGAWHIIPPIFLTLLITGIIYILINNHFRYRYFSFKLFTASAIGCMLAAAKINASLSFLSLFPRTLYPLPGISDFTDLLQLCFISLFGSPDAEFANSITGNKAFDLELHEYEFGVSWIPLIVIGAGFLFYLNRIFSGKTFFQLRSKRVVTIILLLVLLCVPLILNYYTPSWNGFLKSLPFFKNSVTNIRWFSVYIPVLILFATIIIEKNTYFFKYRNAILALSTLFLLYMTISTNRDYYNRQYYNPGPIVKAYTDLKAGRITPEISSIEDDIFMKNNEVIAENTLLVIGISTLKPYEPIFGYRLQNFPTKTLAAGPVMQADSNGVLNLKNPSCYVFPNENNCSPGDHFTIEQKENAEKFRRYLKFPFSMSYRQKIANYLTMGSGCLIFLYIIFYTTRRVLRGRENNRLVE
jgi:hypothetical protein